MAYRNPVQTSQRSKRRAGLAALLLTAAPLAAATLAAGLTALPAAAHESAGQTPIVPGTPVLWTNLGTLSYPVTTRNPEAQAFFDQGLRLAYAFNHAEARRSFRQAYSLDPACAICYWGEALVLGPNINAPMNPGDIAPALAALEKAKAAPGASDKERALIAALEMRYSADPKADRAALNQSYADAMDAVAARYPADSEINTLAAEAAMDTQAWDYWAKAPSGVKEPKGRGTRINELLERALRENPEHPGAIHLYIHLWEASDTPERALPPADRLAALMPGAGHLVHMPSHLYLRVGRYQESIRDNLVAAKADEDFLAKVKDEGAYRGGYYPHNVHFVLVSAQMAGDKAMAVETAAKLSSIVREQDMATVPFVQPIAAAPYFAHVQFSDPDTILALKDPGDTFPYVKGMWHYARAVAQARKGDLTQASAEADAIEAIINKGDLTFLTSNFIPADQILQVARHVALGRVAQKKGYLSSAIDAFSHAATIQDGLPYMEPPFWYYPVRQSLGAALLEAGRGEEAVIAFQEALKEAPGNGWSTFGLAQAQQKLGQADEAKSTGASLTKVWVGAPDFLELSKL
jgi:tetratricopeptide (TPR) repeat protein